MLEYDRIDVSERIDVNKTSKSKEYFINLNFSQKYVMNVIIKC